jgi:drug/metabolite transporter (DMT)-like permease
VAEIEHEPVVVSSRLDLVLIVVAVSGVSFSAPLIAATAAPALAIAFWRTAAAAVVTVPVGLWQRRRELRDYGGRAMGAAVIAGLALALHFATWVPSVTMTSVASATSLVATQSLFVAVIAHVRGRTLPTLAWVGIVISTLGVTLVTGADIGLSGRALVGDGLAVLGGLFAACYVTVGARARQQLPTSVYTSVCYLVCAGLLVVTCLAGRVRLTGFSGNAWIKIALITICAQLLGHTLFNVVLRTTSATAVSLAILFEVPGAAVIAAIWLHQHPPYLAIPGMVLLLGGLVVVLRATSQVRAGERHRSRSDVPPRG